MVSSNFFSTFGVPITLGRDFHTEDDKDGATPTIIFSYSFWQKKFSGRQDVLGSVITLSDKQYQELRDQAIKVIRAVGVETGGSNVQFAVNPETDEIVVKVTEATLTYVAIGVDRRPRELPKD